MSTITITDPNGNLVCSVESTTSTNTKLVWNHYEQLADLQQSCGSIERYMIAIQVMSEEGFGDKAKAICGKIEEMLKDLLERIKKFVIFIKDKISSFFKKAIEFLSNTFNSLSMKMNIFKISVVSHEDKVKEYISENERSAESSIFDGRVLTDKFIEACESFDSLNAFIANEQYKNDLIESFQIAEKLNLAVTKFVETIVSSNYDSDKINELFNSDEIRSVLDENYGKIMKYDTFGHRTTPSISKSDTVDKGYNYVKTNFVDGKTLYRSKKIIGSLNKNIDAIDNASITLWKLQAKVQSKIDKDKNTLGKSPDDGETTDNAKLARVLNGVLSFNSKYVNSIKTIILQLKSQLQDVDTFISEGIRMTQNKTVNKSTYL